MFVGRRTFAKTAVVAGAAAVAPQLLARTARGQSKNKVLFVESNPKAIAVYDKINADFKKERPWTKSSDPTGQPAAGAGKGSGERVRRSGA